MEVKLDMKYYDYDRIKKFGPMTPFKDIKVGKTYHIPPTILYGRRDIVVEYKDLNTIRGQLRDSDGSWRSATFYKTELSMIFLVERQEINKH
jgi:predicted esterase